MAPARTRPAPEDPKLDAVNGKERNTNAGPSSSKVRKNGTNNAAAGTAQKDIVGTNSNGISIAGGISAPNGTTTTDQLYENITFLDAYRHAYNLDTPTAFRSPINAAVLSLPGLGRHSPTMARKNAKKRISREQLALTVRKHLNGLAVNETDVVVDFLYKVKFQDQSFKKRFAPLKQK